MPKSVVKSLVTVALLFTPTVAATHHWVSLPPPPEMTGDIGHWWLDTDSIAQTGKYTLFTFTRSADRDTPPQLIPGLGRMAIDCANGKTLVEGVCSGSCLPAPAFAGGWLESAHYSSESLLFRTVCDQPAGSSNIRRQSEVKP